jgi:hypothetical protein
MDERRRYKFEGFKVGDTIKAYDFKPPSTSSSEFDGDHYYLIGVIEEIDVMRQGAICYKVRVTADLAAPLGDRIIVFVPYEVFLLEWNERVTLVEEG